MISEYRLMLNREKGENNHPVLVKERTWSYTPECLNSPGDIADMLNTCLQLDQRAEEFLVMVCLDTGGHPLAVFEVSHGTVNQSLVNNRELFVRALLCGAASIVIAHNHPSGLANPSEEDKNVCGKIRQACGIMGIHLLDFIIVGERTYYSFLSHNML